MPCVYLSPRSRRIRKYIHDLFFQSQWRCVDAARWTRAPTEPSKRVAHAALRVCLVPASRKFPNSSRNMHFNKEFCHGDVVPQPTSFFQAAGSLLIYANALNLTSCTAPVPCIQQPSPIPPPVPHAMSLSLFFPPEFRSVVRSLEDSANHGLPLARGPISFDPRLSRNTTPAIDVTESATGYQVLAELPGVKKSDVELIVGDNGRSLTIRGQVSGRSRAEASVDGEEVQTETARSVSPDESESKSCPKSATKHLYSERTYTPNTKFLRTIQFPRAVDPNQVKATMADGVLCVTLARMVLVKRMSILVP